MERTVELHALLREMLLLRHDAVHVVVAHLQPVGSGLAVRSGIDSRSTCQTVECINTYRHEPSVRLPFRFREVRPCWQR